MSHEIIFKCNVNLQGLLENIALGMCFWSSSVKYFGRAHLGRAVEGPGRSC